MLRYGSRRIRKHLTMRTPKKINSRITKANVVFCSRDMLASDNVFPKGTGGEGAGCPPSMVQGNPSAGSPSVLSFHRQSAESMVFAPWRGWVLWRKKEKGGKEIDNKLFLGPGLSPLSSTWLLSKWGTLERSPNCEDGRSACVSPVAIMRMNASEKYTEKNSKVLLHWGHD